MSVLVSLGSFPYKLNVTPQHIYYFRIQLNSSMALHYMNHTFHLQISVVSSSSDPAQLGYLDLGDAFAIGEDNQFVFLPEEDLEEFFNEETLLTITLIVAVTLVTGMEFKGTPWGVTCDLGDKEVIVSGWEGYPDCSGDSGHWGGV